MAYDKTDELRLKKLAQVKASIEAARNLHRRVVMARSLRQDKGTQAAAGEAESHR